MDINNRLFSIQSNGYNIEEVDDYVSFIQTELTKNMKLSRDVQLQKNSLLETIDKLKIENKSLDKKNQKLYRDCVAFAKRLKALEIYDNSPEFETETIDKSTSKMIAEIRESYELLVEENKELKATLEQLTDNSNDFRIVDDKLEKKHNSQYNSCNKTNDVIDEKIAIENEISSFSKPDFQNDISSSKKDDIFISKNNALKDDNISDFKLIPPEKEQTKNKKISKDNVIHSKSKNKFSRSVLNFFSTLLLISSIIVGVISLAVFVFIKNPELTINGFRAYTIHNDSPAFNYSDNDIIITKKISPSEVKVDNIILFKTGKDSSRNIKRVSSIETIDGNLCYKTKKYPDDLKVEIVPQQSLIGVITYKIDYIGKISNYAFAQPYDYIAIVLCVFFLSLFFKIMVSLNKTKEYKIKFDDYDISDFSLEI
ncbi:MAG: hypothetical protein WBK75_02590 [Acutalibacteraceae bacterium]